jgi:hypothetical protein
MSWYSNVFVNLQERIFVEVDKAFETACEVARHTPVQISAIVSQTPDGPRHFLDL